MKAFVVLAAVVACAYAKPQVILSGYSGLQGLTLGGIQYATGPSIVSYAAPAIIAPAVTKTQYHAQDELGQASYGYAHPGQAHAAVRDAFGNVRGSYAYVNPEGKEVRVEYVADGGGFRVASNALPVGPEVPVAPAVPVLVGPAPVQDTPEVAEAKAAHAKLVAEAVARNAEADKADEAKEAEKPQSRRKRGIIAAAAPIALASPAVHTIQVAPALHTLQTVQLAAAPAITYSAIAPAVVAAAQPVREATLTKVVNTPGHAVSYRVD